MLGFTRQDIYKILITVTVEVLLVAVIGLTLNEVTREGPIRDLGIIALLGVVLLGGSLVLVTWVGRTPSDHAAPRNLSGVPAPQAIPEDYSELREREGRRQVVMLLNQIENEIRHSHDLEANHGPTGNESLDQGWAYVAEMEARVDRVLGDSKWPNPADREEFRKDIGALVSDVAGRERIKRYIVIRRRQLTTLHGTRSSAYI